MVFVYVSVVVIGEVIIGFEFSIWFNIMFCVDDGYIIIGVQMFI